MSAILHYIYDPLCGWCYGAEPLVRAARRVEALRIELHAGCLWPQPTRLPADTRAYIQQADGRIAQMSGQPFGAAYLEGLLLDPTMVLDSPPTIAAVLAADAIRPGLGLDMLSAIQHAHYEHGRRVVDPEVQADIAVSCGLDRSAFVAVLEHVATAEHIAAARTLMRRIGAGGFPAFALQRGEDWSAVPNGRYASDPKGFAQWLESQLAQAVARASR